MIRQKNADADPKPSTGNMSPLSFVQHSAIYKGKSFLGIISNETVNSRPSSYSGHACLIFAPLFVSSDQASPSIELVFSPITLFYF